jgi:hypothetical protein
MSMISKFLALVIRSKASPSGCLDYFSWVSFRFFSLLFLPLTLPQSCSQNKQKIPTSPRPVAIALTQ